MSVDGVGHSGLDLRFSGASREFSFDPVVGAMPVTVVESTKRILVAMSGGVDSSVAAALLVELGHEVIGVTMKTFCYSGTVGSSRSCCGLEGISDARRVADQLGIPHFVFDVEEEFGRDVIDDFVSEYARGRTPNPCVRCNSNTKFRDLLRRGRALGCDAIATGHYARIESRSGREIAILRGRDLDKDQSYFLWGLPRGLLPQLRFPVGELDKDTVRETARTLGLTNAEKPESQEICFVPMGDYRGFLRDRLAPEHPALTPGRIVTRSGEQVGEHPGFAGFTVGQRKGLGGGFGEPMYVLEIRPGNREVVVGPKEDLFVDGVAVDATNWLTTSPPGAGDRVGVQLRHRATEIPARIVRADEGIEVEFDKPQRAVSPGQSAAVYDGEQLVGGGCVTRAIRLDTVVQ